MRRSTIKNLLWLCLIIVVLIIVIYSIGLFNLKRQAAKSVREIKRNFHSALNSLTDLDLKGAHQSFENIYQEVVGLKTKTDNLAFLNILIKSLPQTFNNLGDVSLTSIKLTVDLEALKNNSFQWLMTQRGDLLINQLKLIQQDDEKLLGAIEQLKQQAALINYPLIGDFNNLLKELYSSRDILSSVIAWLDNVEPQHLLVLFQNNTEIRPAGGFLGGYADLTLQGGSLTNLEVKDIYDTDGQLKKKIIPPEPLQNITTSWGARDANWFFDFPTSAHKVAQLLAASQFYKERGVNFVGTIATNTKIIQDLLEIVGPLNLPNYNLVINAENFLPNIQKEVEVGQDNKAGHPKKILQVMTPLIFEKLGQLKDDQKKELIKKIGDRLNNKDIMIYFDDVVVESYLKDLQVAGEIINLPKDFNGDYLAVVNTNVGGGKTDAFVKQTIKLKGDINLSGQLTNNLIVRRQHLDTNQSDWWYRATNQDFIQILTSASSKLISADGGEERKIKPLIDYKKQKYEIDPDLAAAQLPTAFNRQNFSVWLVTKPGETKNLKLTYKNERAVDFKRPFIFVLEKQSGVESSFEYTITAPLGYIWQESNGPLTTFTYDTLPARLIISLHLIQK